MIEQIYTTKYEPPEDLIVAIFLCDRIAITEHPNVMDIVYSGFNITRRIILALINMQITQLDGQYEQIKLRKIWIK